MACVIGLMKNPIVSPLILFILFAVASQSNAQNSIDTIAPQINLNTPDTICHQINTTYISIRVSVSDNYYPSNQIAISKTGSVNVNNIGIYSETFTALDGSGNSSSKTRFIYVNDCQGIATGTVKTISKNKFQAFPNPFTDKINITNILPSNIIELRTIEGDLIWRGKNIQEENFQNLNPGVYFLSNGREYIKLLKN